MVEINGKTVLIIEDDDMVRDGVLELLDSEGLRTLQASNGIEGLKIAQKELPDLIICDIMMPGLDGFDVLDALQQEQETSTIPFIFLTAKSDRTDLRRGMQLGADDFITKPFKSGELYNAVLTRLSKQVKQESKSEEKLETLKYNITTFLPHELRTPLNGILASSQLLVEFKETMDKEEINQLHENIYNSAKRLNHTIINYLYFTELTLLRFDPKRLMFFKKNETCQDPESLIADISKLISKNHNRENDLYLSLNLSELNIASEHLSKVFEELVDNAFKFSDKDTKVVIKGELNDNFAKIEIIDNGCGMNKIQIKRISAFEQFDRNIHEQQGSGLGFVISKKLIDIYNGTIDIVSKPEEFTNVCLKIPIVSEVK